MAFISKKEAKGYGKLLLLAAGLFGVYLVAVEAKKKWGPAPVPVTAGPRCVGFAQPYHQLVYGPTDVRMGTIRID